MASNRKNERLVCLVPVDGKEGSEFDKIQAIDFSRGGFGFISERRISLDTQIPIEIELAVEDKPVLVVGRVQWVQQIAGSAHYRIGVSFKNVLHGSKSRLNQYFKENKTA